MGLDVQRLSQAVRDHGCVARVVVWSVRGSAPREAGCDMLVWSDGQGGTIGGGALELRALDTARRLIAQGGTWRRGRETFPLGPALGQCCGGSVTLVYEVFCAQELAALGQAAEAGACFMRPAMGGQPPDTPGRPTLSPAIPETPMEKAGWLVEPFCPARPALWIHGAGHVGRAVVNAVLPLGYEITWLDTAQERFPGHLPQGVNQLIAVRPQDVVAYAPVDAYHLVMTCSHSLDLEICHAILGHGFTFAGLIGSATKWARFRHRLGVLGHGAGEIQRICCPIGAPDLGKSPEAIAVGVAAQLLRLEASAEAVRPPLKGAAV